MTKIKWHIRNGAPKYTYTCAECGAEKGRYESQRPEPGQKEYCSKTCQTLGLKRYKGKKERDAAAVAKEKWRYHNDPKFREWRKASNKRYGYRGTEAQRRNSRERARRIREEAKANGTYDQYLAKRREIDRKRRERRALGLTRVYKKHPAGAVQSG